MSLSAVASLRLHEPVPPVYTFQPRH